MARARGRARDAGVSLAQRFARALEGLAPRLPFAVAVSGGSDSLALLHLASALLGTDRRRGLVVLTVDHGLRAGSREEAGAVLDAARALGHGAHRLDWEGGKPATGIQAAARAARYRLLGAWCLAHGVGDLVVAHTEDDAAETFLMRLARGGGIDALAGMAPAAPVPGAAQVRLLRPLLGFSRGELRADLAARGIAWREDPSNADPRFERRAAARTDGAPRGGRPHAGGPRAHGAPARPRRAPRSARRGDGHLLAAALKLAPEGFATLPRAALAGAPDEIAMRALARALAAVSGTPPRARLAALERLAGRLRHGEPRRDARRLPHPARGPLVHICRELRGIEGAAALRAGEARLWDRRFRVALAPGPAEGEVGALGAAGLAAIRPALAPERLAPIPAPARLALPALRSGGEVLAVPHLAFARDGGRGFSAELANITAPATMSSPMDAL
ncbi:MAG: tRNA lysidine(34) synthetase TilS [Alphaproteobacteria bacterium]|nr:tRNA lysidine(34) synthetase TilS [Alphaproteobacteria bacterium]